MKISTIPQLYRNIRRWTEILAVLSRYGLANWLAQFNLEFFRPQQQEDTTEKLTTAKRMRLALTELGPTFIKLGQLLSTRPDLVGSEIATTRRARRPREAGC